MPLTVTSVIRITLYRHIPTPHRKIPQDVSIPRNGRPGLFSKCERLQPQLHRTRLHVGKSTRAPPRDDVIIRPCLIAAPCAVTLWHFLRSVSLDKRAHNFGLFCAGTGLCPPGCISRAAFRAAVVGGEACESLTPSLPVLPPIETPNPERLSGPRSCYSAASLSPPGSIATDGAESIASKSSRRNRHVMR